jgi:phage shock protein PspC (stress-responsive transcriptional regulator)
MPSLIRFVIVLLFLGGLVAAGMYALTIFVQPQEREVTVRLPARDLFPKGPQ